MEPNRRYYTVMLAVCLGICLACMNGCNRGKGSGPGKGGTFVYYVNTEGVWEEDKKQ